MYREPEEAVNTPFFEWCFFIAIALLFAGVMLLSIAFVVASTGSTALYADF